MVKQVSATEQYHLQNSHLGPCNLPNHAPQLCRLEALFSKKDVMELLVADKLVPQVQQQQKWILDNCVPIQSRGNPPAFRPHLWWHVRLLLACKRLN